MTYIKSPEINCLRQEYYIKVSHYYPFIEPLIIPDTRNLPNIIKTNIGRIHIITVADINCTQLIICCPFQIDSAIGKVLVALVEAKCKARTYSFQVVRKAKAPVVNIAGADIGIIIRNRI